MQFIGRKKELNILNESWRHEEAFIVVSGRRFVGKTALVQNFLNNKNAFYFSASNVSDLMNRSNFEKALKNHFGENSGSEDQMSGQKTIAWKDYFKLYSEKSETGGKVLIIDNFENLVIADPDFLKIFKNAWQQQFSPNGVMVIIIMPNSATLTTVLRSKSFMSQVTRRIDLKPISFVELMKDYPHNDFNQLMLLYAICGGVPHYWYAFDNCVDDKNFKLAIERNFMDPHGELFKEAPALLNQDVWDFLEYQTILVALSEGMTAISSIAAFTGYKQALVEERLDNLMTLGYVSKDTSIVERRMFGRKRIVYRISDPMLSFWYTFIYPFYDAIKQGKSVKAKKKLKTYFAEYIQYWFKRVATEIFLTASRQGSIPIECEDVGEYFNDNGDKIDIIGIDNKHKRIFLGDCTYGNQAYTKKKYDHFVENCKNIKELKKAFRDYEWVYGIFSAYPFESELLDYSLITKNVLLFNGITIYSLNT